MKKGENNGSLVRSMVHLASYAKSCPEFFLRIAEGVKLLAHKNPELTFDYINVRIYLL